MTNEDPAKLQVELHELDGALDALFSLREEFAQWAEEAQDDSKREALENVLGHVEVIELQYKQRRDALNQHLKAI